jgi:hypothetical protein
VLDPISQMLIKRAEKVPLTLSSGSLHTSFGFIDPTKHKSSMPVTIRPSDLAAKLFATAIYEEPISNRAELLQFSCPKEHENVKNGRIFQSSFDKLSKEDGIFESDNGL